MRFLIRIIATLTLMSWGQFVFAENYYWQILNYSNMGTFSSHVAAAQAFVATRDAHYSLTSKNETFASYRIMRNSDNGGIGNISVQRSGTGCTLPAIYNSETGECEAPPKTNAKKKPVTLNLSAKKAPLAMVICLF